MVDTELTVKVAASGAGKAAKDVAAIQDAIAKVAKETKDAKAVAQQLGAAFDLDSSEVEDLAKALASVKREASEAKAEAKGLGNVFQGVFQGVGQQLLGTLTGAVSGAVSGIKDLVASTLSIGGAAQQSEVAFATMLGSVEAGKAAIADLQQFAATTPFEFPQVREAGQSLLAFGVDVDNLTETLTRVGNVASGVGTDFNELAVIYGKAKTQGRLFAEDINQLTGRGIPIIQELAKQFGVSEQQVKGLVESGKVGFPQLEQAFVAMTSEGGKFFNLMEEQSKTIPGQISNLSDRFTQLQKSLFDAFEPSLSAGLRLFSDVLNEASANSDGLDPLVDAGNRLKEALEGNPELAEALGRYLATLANETVTLVANALTGLANWLDENPDKVVQFFDDIGDGITTISKFIEGVSNAVAVLDQFVSSIPGGENLLGKLFDATKFGPLTAGIEFLQARLENIVSLMERAGLIAPEAFESGIAQSVTKAAGAIDTLKGAVDKLNAGPTPTPVEPEEVESVLKRMVEANRDALGQIETDSANAKAQLLEDGVSQEEIARAEESALQKRVQQNRTYLAQLVALQANGGLNAEDAAKVADAIAQVESQLAKDRVSAAQSTVEAQKAAEAERVKAAKAAADAAQKAAEAKAKAETDALKEARDEEKRLAEQAQADREKAAQRKFDDARDGRSETRDAQRRAQDKALQEALQADDRAHQNERRESDRAFQKQQQAEADAFQKKQQDQDKAFQEQQQKKREQGSRQLSALEKEAERRVQLDGASSSEKKRLEKQFEEEDKALKRRRKIEEQVVAEQDSIINKARRDGTLEASPLEEARRKLEMQLQAEEAAFQEQQQLAAQAFQESQTAEAEARAEEQRLADEARADARAAEEDARAEQRRLEDKAFEDSERAIQDAFEAEQRSQKEAFNAQQRELDKANAQQIAAILEAAKPRGIDGARRDGGPVRAGGTYLVGEEGPELVTMRRGGYVHTAAQTAAMLSGTPVGRGGVQAPQQPSMGAVESKLDELIRTVKARPPVRSQATYNLNTATPQVDAVAMQLAELRGLVRGGGL